jgi:uncharacterized Rmd1/YagE family protein
VSIFATGKSHTIVAYAFAENFRMSKVQAELGAAQSLMDPKDSVSREVPGGGWVYAYNFGCLVFWNVSPETRIKEMEQFRLRREGGLSEPAVSEDFVVEEDTGERPRAEFSRLILDKVTPQRAEVVALTVAQSAAMSYYESLLEKSQLKLAAMLTQLEHKGNVGRSPAKLHRFIAETVIMRSEIVGVLHLLDRPDLIWEDKTMDSLYDDLRAVFDLKERFQALVHKLDYIQDSAEILLDMARDSRLFLVEMAIVFLIAVELAMSIFR